MDFFTVVFWFWFFLHGILFGGAGGFFKSNYEVEISFCFGFIKILILLACSYVTARCELTALCWKLCDELIYLFVVM